VRPSARLFGQGVRFAVAGAIVGLINTLSTLALSDIAGLPFQVALLIGFALALTVHFTLQRLFVWADRGKFALPLHHQVGRYLLLAGAQYGITAASTSLLPPILGLPTEVVYLATVALTLSVNFLFFRSRVFHAAPSAAACASPPARMGSQAPHR
jgi:putative flippase GtrA